MAPAHAAREPRPDQTMAILSLVFAFVMPLVGLILSLIARKDYPEGVEGHSMVKAALIISIILTAIPLLIIIAAISFLSFAAISM